MRHIIAIISVVAILLVACTSSYDPPAPPVDEKRFGKYISPKEALDIAEAAFANFGFKPRSRGKSTASVMLYDDYLSRGNEVDSTFYVVNFFNGGFAVVAGERGIGTPILALSEDGVFETDGNESVQYFMELGREYYSSPGIYNPRIDSIGLPIDSTITFTNRYVPTLWGQDDPYNAYCPLLSSGRRCPTGCGPLSIGQIMAFHRYPESFIYLNADSVTTSEIALDWEMMTRCNNIDDLKELLYLESVDHIQKLLRNIGIKCRTYYSANISMTKPTIMERALNEYGFHAVYDKSKNYESWLKSIIEDGPVILLGYNGVGLGAHSGHAWLADALKKVEFHYWAVIPSGRATLPDTKYYLHMNWGFEGKSNGFYLYDVIVNQVRGESDGKYIEYSGINCITQIYPL